jgi:hypothetical protein
MLVTVSNGTKRPKVLELFVQNQAEMFVPNKKRYAENNKKGWKWSRDSIRSRAFYLLTISFPAS